MFFLMMSFLLILLNPTSNHIVSAKKHYHLSKIKFPTFDEALDNLEDIIHSGCENVHILSLRAPVYGKSPAVVLQPKEERIFQQPCSSSPHLESVLPRPCCEVCFFFFPGACSYYGPQILSQRFILFATDVKNTTSKLKIFHYQIQKKRKKKTRI